MGNTTTEESFKLDLFPTPEFESESEGRNYQEKSNIIARNALRILMMGWNSDYNQLLTMPVFSAVFLQRDPALMRGMRLGFQQGFAHVFNQLQAANINPETHPAQWEQTQLFLSNCLSILPFGDINPFEFISMPQWVAGSWQMVDYRVQPIELTPTSGFKALFINDYDRVFAYGLEPITNDEAQPHLIFMGTTYPAGQGFWSQIKTDLQGFDTAGKQLYRNSHKKIKQWLDKQNQKTHVCGVSLGGALSLLLAIHHGDSLARVDALNPPGLYVSWHRSSYDLWDKLQEKPKVVVQKNRVDPVSLFGEWKEDWEVIDVIPPAEKEGPNSTAAHAMNYAGLEGTQFNVVDIKADNDERRTRNFLFYKWTRGFIYYCLFNPYYYFVLPLARFLKNNFLTIVQTAAVALVITLLLTSPINLLVIGITTIFCIALIPAVTALFSTLISGVKTLFGYNQPKPAHCHEPSLARNAEMDLYSETNKIEERFTVKELTDYYSVKRCQLKNKELIPANDSPRSKVEFVNTTKRAVLELNADENHASDNVTIRATRAKVSDIKQTLFYKNQGGNDMNEHLLHQDMAYQLGTKLL